MKRKDWARSPPTTRNIPELGISDSIPLTEYFPFRSRTPKREKLGPNRRGGTLVRLGEVVTHKAFNLSGEGIQEKRASENQSLVNA